MVLCTVWDYEAPNCQFKNNLDMENKQSNTIKQGMAYDRLLAAVAPEMEYERYEYKGVLLQRLNKDYLWYAIHKNQIINWSKYRNDLERWIDSNCG